MAYTLKLGTFAKKKNSTAQPDMTGWAEFSVTLKGGSDLLNPLLDLNCDMTDIINYNYAYIFGSYYFIRDKAMIRSGLCTIALEEDVLANYKEAIGNSTLYIVRSSAAYDGYIKDNYYPLKANKTTIGEIIDTDDIGLGSGCYIVNILGNNTANSTLYLMSPADFNTFLNSLLAAVGPYVGLDFTQAAVNAIFEPLQYIKSIIWLPMSVADATSAFGATLPAGNVHAGLWDSGFQAPILNTGAALVRTRSITVPKHPQAASRGAYLNGAPFSTYILNYPPFGVINVDSSKLIDETTINLNIYADAITGIGIMQAFGSNTGGPLFNLTAQYGVPIPLSGATANLSSVASTIGAAGEILGGLITGNPILTGVGAAKGISSFGDAIRGVPSSGGAAGSLAAWQTSKTFGGIFHYIADEDNVNTGRPYCQITTPASLGGYMIAEKAPLSFSCTSTELEEIESYLTSGFYYE